MRAVSLVILAACAGPSGRSLSIVQRDVVDPSEDDTGAVDTGAPEAVRTCGSDGTPQPGALGVAVDVDWCVRVTPEAAFTDIVPGDTDPPPESGMTSAAPPPCGFVNLVGSLSLAGTPAHPAVLYCDSDTDGGTRFVRYSPADGTLESTLLSALDCQSEPSTGVLANTADGGYFAVWAGSGGPGEEGANLGVITAQLDGDGNVVEGPDYLAAGGSDWKLSVVGGDPSTVLVNDADLDLWSMSLGTGEEAASGARLVSPSVRSVAAVQFGSSVVVAVCENDESLHLFTLDSSGARASDVAVDGGLCSYSTQPALAVADGVLALAWDDGINGTIAFLDADLLEVSRSSLGLFASQPQLVWTGSAFLVLTTNGALTSYSPEGDAGGTVWHHGFMDADGGPQTDRLLYADGQLVYGYLGTDSYPIGGGHINTYNYFEISGSALP